MRPAIRNFEVLFDDAERGALQHPAYARYGASLAFPASPPHRPWIFSNFVQSLDGIASFLGRHAAGADISRSPEDRWLMDLLRAHADGVLLGLNTLRDEAALASSRGPVFRIMDEELRGLRRQLGKPRERNIFVTGAARLDLSAYRAFDGEHVDAVIVTSPGGAARLAAQKGHPHVRVVAAGEGERVDLPEAMRRLRTDLAVEYLLCEGGPTLNGHLERAGLIDERFLTLSPIEVGALVPREQEPAPFEKDHPPAHRPTTFNAPGFLAADAPWWQWLSCRRVGHHQFSRYRRRRVAGS
jgi:riboflavin biosynthesis pyrimidine reductase